MVDGAAGIHLAPPGRGYRPRTRAAAVFLVVIALSAGLAVYRVAMAYPPLSHPLKVQIPGPLEGQGPPVPPPAYRSPGRSSAAHAGKSPLSTWKVAKYRVEGGVQLIAAAVGGEAWRLATTVASHRQPGGVVVPVPLRQLPGRMSPGSCPGSPQSATMKSRKKMEMNPPPEKSCRTWRVPPFFRGCPVCWSHCTPFAGDKIHQPQVAPGISRKRQETLRLRDFYPALLASQRSGAGFLGFLWYQKVPQGHAVQIVADELAQAVPHRQGPAAPPGHRGGPSPGRQATGAREPLRQAENLQGTSPACGSGDSRRSLPVTPSTSPARLSRVSDCRRICRRSLDAGPRPAWRRSRRRRARQAPPSPAGHKWAPTAGNDHMLHHPAAAGAAVLREPAGGHT